MNHLFLSIIKEKGQRTKVICHFLSDTFTNILRQSFINLFIEAKMLKRFHKLAIISILLLQSSSFPQFWEYQAAGTTEHLNGVYMHDTQSGWICGNAGILLKTTNGGQNWTQVAVTANDINSITFKNINTGIAVGDNGIIIRTTNGGANWNSVTSGTTDQFRKVSSGAGSIFFASGDNGLAAVSTDNGATWALKNSGTTLRLSGAFAYDANKLWAAGENGLIRYSSDGGNNWATQVSGITTAELHDIQFVNESVGFAGGSNSNFIFTNDGGLTWAPRNSGLFSDVNGIYFQDANIGWGVSIVGTIYFTTDGGSSWTSQPCGSAFTLREAYFLHQGKGWTVGDNGTIAMYTNAALPVELNSFTSSVTGNNVGLVWSTATETNNSGFEIERKVLSGQSSISNSEFQFIGFLEGKGTTTNATNYSFADRGLDPGVYNYRIKQIDFDGSFKYYELNSEVTIESPMDFSLNQNYPNPFNPTTVIKFSIPDKGNVTMKVYDIIGNEVAALVNENKDAGVFEVSFNGEGLSSGIYLYQLRAANFVETRKMTLIK